MKSKWNLVLLVFMYTSVCAQAKVDTLVITRDSIFREYLAHRDTMTVNTWINIMTANRQLEKLRLFDSLIQVKLMDSVNTVNNDSEIHSELSELQDSYNLLALKNLNNLKDKNYYQRFYGVSVFVMALLFILLFILFLIVGKLMRKVKQKERLLSKLQAELYIAKESIEKYGVTENHLLSEINKIKKQHAIEIDTISQSKQGVEDEMLMLENQMIEVRKAYGIEVQKRRDLETSIAENPSPLTEKQAEMGEQINLLTNELEDALSENEKLKMNLISLAQKEEEKAGISDELGKLKLEYENEVKTRLRIEKELQNLIEGLRNHFD